MSISFLQSTSQDDVKERVLEVLMREAREADSERREQGRVPFFQPAIITPDGDEDGKTAFTRDIAHDGIGLLHAYPVEPQLLNVDLHVADGGQVQLAVDILWCVPCGDGWYISGGDIMNGSVVK
ncbi:hypothetical protein ACFL2H_04630 [Planctomycetota bacterium]